MNEFHTSYQKFDLPDENEQPANEDAYLMHVPDSDKGEEMIMLDPNLRWLRLVGY